MISHEIDFVKLDPTQNMTLLVRTEHPEEEHRDIALRLMAYEHLHAEQVGFVRKPGSPDADISLRMAGGEFCGNACMALAALAAPPDELAGGHPVDVVLEASGARDLVRCRVLRHAREYTCELAMPLPESVERGADGVALVRYDDSLHVVVETGRPDPALRAWAQRLAARLGERGDASLIGVMLYEPRSGHLTPLVHVPLLGSAVWERGCGSGAAALAAYLAWEGRTSVTTRVRQPGGVMTVAADHARGALTGVRVQGTVRVVAEGRAYL
ncbi:MULTISPECIES: diaminopimelate epimerase [Actinosynnema]|uniref:Diaminopimelate epimerase n=1 Tax=Actinosynnema pretiosum TaxID=42197 RepID=A0A290Z8C8_9PSEU|nr:diaminopimelate epimerase [Actinosynnema pretiosum]ATE55232.1 diaminopimelate epimerase [Actinosynnema pretiosum]